MNPDGRMEVIRELCSFDGRLAGTDAERRAANRLAEQLRERGRQVEIEPTTVHPQIWLIHAIHAALGFGGSLISIAEPAVGFAMVLASAVSLYLDFNTRFYLLRSLFFRRASQNVFSPGKRSEATARVILNAHYDVARTGYLWREKSRRREALVPRRLRVVLAPPRLFFWSLASLLPIIGARMAGLEGSWLDLLQLLPTLVLMVSAFLLIDLELSDVVPGANDDASGVATALAVSAALEADPPEHLEVSVLLTGGEECGMEGMRSFVRAHRQELDRESTYFLVLEMLGSGRLHYLAGEGLAVTYRHDARLAGLCEAISTATAEETGELEATPVVLIIGSDALPATLAGYPAITIYGLAANGLPGLEYHTPNDTPERIEPEALDRAQRFVLELVSQLDRDVGRRSAAR